MSGNTSDGILRLETTPQAFLGGLGGHHWAAFVSVGDGRSEAYAVLDSAGGLELRAEPRELRAFDGLERDVRTLMREAVLERYSYSCTDGVWTLPYPMAERVTEALSVGYAALERDGGWTLDVSPAEFAADTVNCRVCNLEDAFTTTCGVSVYDFLEGFGMIADWRQSPWERRMDMPGPVPGL